MSKGEGGAESECGCEGEMKGHGVAKKKGGSSANGVRGRRKVRTYGRMDVKVIIFCEVHPCSRNHTYGKRPSFSSVIWM